MKICTIISSRFEKQKNILVFLFGVVSWLGIFGVSYLKKLKEENNILNLLLDLTPRFI